MKNKKMNIMVLMGGPSDEHEVSLSTGKQILNALDKDKYSISSVTIGKDGKWLLSNQNKLDTQHGDQSSEEKSLTTIETGRAIDQMKSSGNKIDVALIAMHGKFGEDGTIQGLLESVGIPYTGSGVLASALAMDKVRSSELFLYHGLLVPEFMHYSKNEWQKDGENIIQSIKNKFGFPCVIKPTDSGSSVGVTIVKKFENLKSAIELAFEKSNTIMAQEFISGREVTCGVLDFGGDIGEKALTPTEIIPKNSDFFDYKAKYTPGASNDITPPNMEKDIIEKIQAIALKAHTILGCSGMSRTDMMVLGDDIYVLETNTIPGMTPTSLLPQEAQAEGISFPQLLDRIIQSALKKK